MEIKKTSPFRYSLGTLGGSLPFNMFTTFMAFYYVDTLMLPMRIFSLGLVVYTTLDLLDNLVYGYLSDRTRTRIGRRKPWLFAASVLFPVSFIAFFSPPSWLSGRGGTGFVVYFIVTMLLVETTMSMIQINYNALLPDLFRSEGERASANSLRQLWMLLATIIGVALAPIITRALGYPVTSVIFGAISVLVLNFMITGCRENPDFNEYKSPPLFKSFKEILANVKFWLAAGAGFLYYTTQTLLMAGMPFFVKYALGLDSGATSIVLGTALVTAIVSLFGWAKAIKKFTLVPVWRAAYITMAVSFVPLYLAHSLAAVVAGGIVVGLGLGGIGASNDIVIAALVDEDKIKYGQRREGMYSSIVGFANKLNGFVRSFVFFLVFVIYGFESGDAPGPNPAGASKFILIGVPLLLMAIAVICTWFVSFKKKENV